MERGDELMEEARREYQEDPKGWSFWVSPSSEPSDPHEVYMIHRDEAYFFKIDSIYTPKPVRVGTKMEIKEDQFVKGLPDFGFRKFSKQETKKLLRSLRSIGKDLPSPPKSKEDYQEKLPKAKKTFKRMDEEIRKAIAKKRPVPSEPLHEPGELAAIGPYAKGDPLSYISDKQAEVKKELSKELRKLEEREHPEYQ